MFHQKEHEKIYRKYWFKKILWRVPIGFFYIRTSIFRDQFGEELPQTPASEDQKSTKRHIECLKNTSWVRREVDAKEAKELLDLTLHDHRKYLVVDGELSILRDYPWLMKNLFVILDEIHRISNVNVEEATTEFLQQYRNSILKACKGHNFDIVQGAAKYMLLPMRPIWELSTWGRLKVSLWVWGPRACSGFCHHSVPGDGRTILRLDQVYCVCRQTLACVMGWFGWSCWGTKNTVFELFIEPSSETIWRWPMEPRWWYAHCPHCWLVGLDLFNDDTSFRTY